MRGARRSGRSNVLAMPTMARREPGLEGHSHRLYSTCAGGDRRGERQWEVRLPETVPNPCTGCTGNLGSVDCIRLLTAGVKLDGKDRQQNRLQRRC